MNMMKIDDVVYKSILFHGQKQGKVLQFLTIDVSSYVDEMKDHSGAVVTVSVMKVLGSILGSGFRISSKTFVFKDLHTT